MFYSVLSLLRSNSLSHNIPINAIPFTSPSLHSFLQKRNTQKWPKTPFNFTKNFLLLPKSSGKNASLILGFCLKQNLHPRSSIPDGQRFRSTHLLCWALRPARKRNGYRKVFLAVDTNSPSINTSAVYKPLGRGSVMSNSAMTRCPFPRKLKAFLVVYNR